MLAKGFGRGSGLEGEPNFEGVPNLEGELKTRGRSLESASCQLEVRGFASWQRLNTDHFVLYFSQHA